MRRAAWRDHHVAGAEVERFVTQSAFVEDSDDDMRLVIGCMAVQPGSGAGRLDRLDQRVNFEIRGPLEDQRDAPERVAPALAP